MDNLKKQRALIIAVSIFALAIFTYFVFAAHVITPTSTSVLEDISTNYNITVNNTDANQSVANITEVNITLPSGFTFTINTNQTDESGATFTNTSSVLSWNKTTGGLVPANTTRRFTFNATAVTPGTFNITVSTQNSTFVSRSNVTVTVNDTTAPTGEIISPVNNTITNVTSQTFRCNATDGNALSAIKHYIWYVNSSEYVTNTTSVSGTNNATNWTYTITTNSNYTWNCQVNDTANNQDWDVNRTIIIDTVAPTKPTFTCTSSVYVGESVSCSCSGSTDTTSGLNSSYGTNGYSYTASPSTSTSGTFTETCYVRDLAGNENSSTASYTVSVKQEGGGGGGGGETWTKTIVVNDEQFKEGYVKDLGANHRLKIVVANIDHYVGVLKITTSLVDIEVSSTPQKATLSVGETKKFDVTNDGYYDIQVILEGIKSSLATINIKSIYEKIALPVQEQPPTVQPTPEEKPAESGVTGKVIEEGKSGTGVLVFLIVLVVVIVSVIIFLRLKKAGKI
ncbi:hypothetical protein HYV49_03755 [Candidatus Pacearchaeota archaeon]|nr:hypothetical protein [Candidatus Pacearchaeota archaeon]